MRFVIKAKLGKLLKLSDIAVKVKERELRFVFDKFGDNSLVFELTNLYGKLSSSGYSKSIKGDLVQFILKKEEKFKWTALHSEQISVVRYSSPDFGNHLPIKKEFSSKQIHKNGRLLKKDNTSANVSGRPSQKRRPNNNSYNSKSNSQIRKNTPTKRTNDRYNNNKKEGIISRIEGEAGMGNTSLVDEFCKDLYDFFGDGSKPNKNASSNLNIIIYKYFILKYK